MFTDIFGHAPRVKLLDFLADHVDFDYTISQMAEFAEIARPTVYKLVAELQNQGMLTFTRQVGDSRFYRLNLDNLRIISMLQVDFEGVNRELASGTYDEPPESREEATKALSQPRPGGSRSLRSGTVPVRTHLRRTPKGRRRRPR